MQLRTYFADWDKRRRELAEAATELINLPMEIEEIIEIEEKGFVVDLMTGAVAPDTDRFALTLGGQAMAVVIGTGFLEEGGGL